MKKFFAVIFAVLIFSLCGCSEADIPEIPEEDVPESISSKTEEETDSFDKKGIIEEIKRDFGPEHHIYNNWYDKFEELGISVSLGKIEFTDEENWKSSITLSKGEHSLSIDFEGICVTEEIGGEDFSFAAWGSFVFPDGGGAVFCGKDKVVFFGTKDLSIYSPEIDFPEHENGSIWVNGADYSAETGEYIIFTTKIGTASDEYATVSFYDRDGSFLREEKTAVFGSHENLGRTFPRFMERVLFFEIEGKEAVLYGNLIAGIESDVYYYASKESFAEKDHHSLEIYTYYNEDLGSDYFGGKKIAFLFNSGVLVDYMIFEEPNFSVIHNEPDTISLEVSANEEKAVYKSRHFGMTLELDFEKSSHKISYNPTDEIISKTEVGPSSADGKYTVCYFGETSGGDAWNSHLAIKNNENGNYVYIGETGGMWGGYGGMGFLKNGDFYIFSLSSLKILDPENGNTLFDFSENFPLGKTEKGEKGLLTFRRDPVDFSYIAVYYETEDEPQSVDVEQNEFGNWHYEWNFNYKIGFFDSKGNLLESYDTGIPVLSEHFGLFSVDMQYSPEKLTLIIQGGRSSGGFTGYFDMNTKEFTYVPLYD